jgi:hypothetical protein
MDSPVSEACDIVLVILLFDAFMYKRKHLSPPVKESGIKVKGTGKRDLYLKISSAKIHR